MVDLKVDSGLSFESSRDETESEKGRLRSTESVGRKRKGEEVSFDAFIS